MGDGFPCHIIPWSTLGPWSTELLAAAWFYCFLWLLRSDKAVPWACPGALAATGLMGLDIWASSHPPHP